MNKKTVSKAAAIIANESAQRKNKKHRPPTKQRQQNESSSGFSFLLMVMIRFVHYRGNRNNCLIEVTFVFAIIETPTSDLKLRI